MKLLKIILVYALALLAFFLPANAAELSITSNRSDIVASAENGLYLLEKSGDLRTWDPVDLMFLPNSAPLAIPLQTLAPEEFAYFRIFGPLTEENGLDFRITTLSHSKHLARLTFRDIFQIDFLWNSL